MEEKNSRKVFLSVLGVSILIVAVVGISYATFTFTNSGAQDNTITTGTITMSYSEPEAGLSLSDELPMTDAAGIERDEYFDFSVSTNVTGKVAIPYEINIVPTFTENTTSSCTVTLDEGVTLNATNCGEAGGTFTQGYDMLPASNVKVYLESNRTDGTNYAQALAPTTIAAKTVNGQPVGGLTASAFAGTTNRTGALKLLDVTDDYTTAAGNKTTGYRLRMWIDNDTQVELWDNAKVYKYALKVNVDSTVAPLS